MSIGFIGNASAREPAADLAVVPGPGLRSREPRSLLITGTILFAFALLAILVVWPLAMLAYAAFRSGSPMEPTSWTLAGLRALPGELTGGHALLNSILIAVLPTAFGVGAAIILAFLQTRTDSPLRRLIPLFILISTAISILFYAISFSFLGDPFSGVLNSVWESVTGSKSYVVNLDTWFGIILVESIVASSHVYLFLIGPLSAFDQTYEEVALVGRASRLRTQVRITMPLILPVITSVVLLGLMGGFQSFESVLVLGDRSHLDVLGYQIYNLISLSNPPQYPQAAAIGLFLTMVLLIFIYLQYRFLRHGDFRTITGKSYRTEPITLGRWRWLGGAFIVAYGLIAVVIPFVSVFVASLQPYAGTLSGLNFSAYGQVLANPVLIQAITTTLVIAVVTGVCSSLAGFYIVYAARFAAKRTSVVLRGLTLLPAAMPGTAGALAVLWAYVSLPGLRSLFDSIWLLIIALTVQNLIVTVQIAHSAFVQLSPDLEEAALVAGASRLRAVRLVTIPLISNSLIAAGLLSAVLAVGNATVPLLLSGPSTQTVTTEMLTMIASDYQQNDAAALLVIWVGVLLACGALYLGGRALLRRRRARALAAPPTAAPIPAGDLAHAGTGA